MALLVDTEKVAQVRKWLGSGSIDLFGMPFAGKDTQGQRLGQLFGAPVLGGGDILRNSVIPKHVKEIMHAGLLIPTQDYLEIVLPYLSQEHFVGKPLVLSAVGRWHGEEAGVLEATAEAQHPIKAVVNLSLDEAAVRARWETLHTQNDRGARIDDTAETLEIRLEEYRQKTVPVINFYREENLLLEVDATLAPEAVTAQIINKLFELIRHE